MKLVKESLNEMNFQKKRDPLGALEIGRKQLIIDWLDNMDVKNYTINDDYTIDVNGGVDLFDKSIEKFPDFIQFNIINGVFVCQKIGLTSLKGCPIEVSTIFTCSENRLESLLHCPNYVGGTFYCYNNKVEFTEKYVRSLCNVKGDIISKNKI
jgi:hypothetical protein